MKTPEVSSQPQASVELQQEQSLLRLTSIVAHAHDLVQATTESAPESADYTQRVRAAYDQLATDAQALMDAGKGAEVKPLLDQLYARVVSLERRGSTEFKNHFHNNLVHKPDGRFLLAAYEHFMTSSEPMPITTPAGRLQRDAAEFDVELERFSFK